LRNLPLVIPRLELLDASLLEGETLLAAVRVRGLVAEAFFCPFMTGLFLLRREFFFETGFLADFPLADFFPVFLEDLFFVAIYLT
jgi:hypothetical protein